VLLVELAVTKRDWRVVGAEVVVLAAAVEEVTFLEEVMDADPELDEEEPVAVEDAELDEEEPPLMWKGNEYWKTVESAS